MVAALPEERLLLESDQHAALWKTACCHFGLEHASPYPTLTLTLTLTLTSSTPRQRQNKPRAASCLGQPRRIGRYFLWLAGHTGHGFHIGTPTTRWQSACSARLRWSAARAAGH